MDDRSSVPAPFSIPLPFEEHPIDLATALRLADVSNPDDRRGSHTRSGSTGQSACRAGAARSLAQFRRELPRASGLAPAILGQDHLALTAIALHGRRSEARYSRDRRATRREYLYSAHGCMVRAAGRTPASYRCSIPRPGDRERNPARCRECCISNCWATSRSSRPSVSRSRRCTTSSISLGITPKIGLGRDSDANRAFSQWKRRRADVLKAEEELAVAAARLANRLNLDPSARLEAAGGPLGRARARRSGNTAAGVAAGRPAAATRYRAPEPRQSARPRPTSNRKSAGRSCPRCG